MAKLLVQTTASVKDPRISDQMIDGVPFRNFFHFANIYVLIKELVESCHGNTKYSLMTAEQMQKLADEGHRVSAMQSGGLYFAKPSLEAANAPTVLITSVPLGGLDAFLAPSLPAGTAAIGGVAPSNYGAAARFLVETMMQDFPGVYVWGMQSDAMMSRLREFGIPVIDRVKPVPRDKPIDGLLVGEVMLSNLEAFDSAASAGIYSITAEPSAHMRAAAGLKNSVFTRSGENIAFLAAKAMSQYNRTAFDALKKAAKDKADSFKEPNLALEAWE